MNTRTCGTRVERWWWVPLLWTGFALINSSHVVGSMPAVGMRNAWPHLFYSMAFSSIIWLATPLILRLVHHFPPDPLRPLHTLFVHLSACVVLGMVYSAGTVFLQSFFYPWRHAKLTQFWEPFFSLFYGEFLLFFVVYVAILAVSCIFESQNRVAHRETEEARRSEQLSRTQLDAVRRQLEPDFLFNTLNAIAGLVSETRNRAAVKMIADLSALLRRALDTSEKQVVSLGEEVAFLRNYIDIQEMRFGDRLQFSITVPADLLSVRVAGRILQPIVENAIEQGIGKRDGGGTIRIDATRDNGLLIVTISADVPRITAGSEQLCSGINMSNVRARLQCLYGHDYSLKLGSHDARVQVLLSVPCKTNF